MSSKKKSKKVRKKGNKTQDNTTDELSIDKLPPVKTTKKKKIIKKKKTRAGTHDNTRTISDSSEEFTTSSDDNLTLSTDSEDNITLTSDDGTKSKSVKSKSKKKVSPKKKGKKTAKTSKSKTSSASKSSKTSSAKSVSSHKSIQTLKIPPFPEIEYQNYQYSSNEDLDIQQIISDAPANAQILIPSGFYQVQLNLEKPVSLIAQGEAIILSPGKNHTITVNSPGVSIKGFKICQKYSEIHSAIYVHSGSVRISDCHVSAEYAPAVVASLSSVTHIKNSQISSTKAPSIFAFEEAQISVDNSTISESSTSGIVICGSSTAKFTKCVITCHQKSGFICKEQCNLQCEGCTITGCGSNGLEIGSSGLINLNSCSIEGCDGSGIVVHSSSSVNINQSTISYCKGPAIQALQNCSLFLQGNKYVSCGQPSLIYAQNSASVKSVSDSFFGTEGGILLLENAKLVVEKSNFDSLICGINSDGKCKATVKSCTFLKTQKSSISAVNGSEINISDSKISSSAEDGIILNGVNKCHISKTTIENCGFSGIDSIGSSDVVLSSLHLLNNRNAGVVCTKSDAEISDCTANGNGIVAFEFRTCKGTLKKCVINENACGIICNEKGSATVEKCKMSGNKQGAILLIINQSRL